jgi:leucyl-tRNA synthetase
MKSFDFASAEKKWQKQWDKEKLFEIKYSSFSSSRSKNKYILDMFPYPSGGGLHVGHAEGYTASDIISRFYRMNGYNVLHPMGWDAFGLPAENYAIKHKTHPALVVKRNVAIFKNQLKSLGFSYDWSKEINTTDPEYYKWTQWIFLQLFKAGLAYEKEVPVNWCPSCKTVLSDEEAESGVCNRCGNKVERKHLKQWMLKITAYADKLLEGLKSLNWPERVKTMQKNWIGKSEGARIKFSIASKPFFVEVFTTRPDTIFGGTYLVLAPEHPLIFQLGLNIKNWKEISAYVELSKNRSDQERISESKDKTGVELSGVYAINPANGKKIPIWVADYVLPYYGTGAIMAVPAHDQRDWDFAKKFKLPIIPVISPDGKITVNGEVYESDGILVNSGRFDGKKNREELPFMVDFVKGKRETQFKLRDWIFSRQRYWGEPIPLVFCEACAGQVKSQKSKIKDLSKGELLNPGWVSVPEKELPLELPKVKNYKPTGTLTSPLAAVSSWINTKCPRCGGPAKRETNTMPQWAGSCWYYLRYIDPKNSKKIIDPKKEKSFMPVDLYIGGVEHAVLHLLYARFWHRVLFDKKIVKDPEPFMRLVNQGLILGSDGEKMSKSKGNVVNPDDIIKEFGADALRMYEMFMGPLEDQKPWNARGIIGISRFLSRVWFLYKKQFASKSKKFIKVSGKTVDFERTFHQSLKKVTEDIESLRFNTAISALMILLKGMEALPSISKEYADKFVLMLSPFAPFICESIWREVLKNKKSVVLSKWPAYNSKKAAEEFVTIAVQINGRTRGMIKTAKNSQKEEVLKAIESDAKLGTYIKDKKIKRVVFVPNRIVNILL